MKQQRLTNQRIKILSYLQSVKSHPNAETVYSHVSTELPAITLATVYRNLNVLAEQGLIRRFTVGNEYRYDADVGCHQHCVCSNCKKMVDFCDKSLSRMALKKCPTDFDVEDVKIIYEGTCKQCIAQKKGDDDEQD